MAFNCVLKRPAPWLAMCFSAALFVISGCTANTPAPIGKLFERNGVSMIAVPDNLRETYFGDLDSSERFCRATSSDVSITTSQGFSLGMPPNAITGTGGSAISETSGAGSVALGGRNPAVLITRELMYRACEFTSNLDLPFEKAMQVYERFLQAIEKIAITQTGSGTPALSAAPSLTPAPLPSGTPVNPPPPSQAPDPDGASSQGSGG